MTDRRLGQEKRTHRRSPAQLGMFLLSVAVLVLLSSCPEPILTARLAQEADAGSTTYTVTYDGNGSTGGTVPTDANNYEQGTTVTVAGPGTMTRTGYTFVGWNTAADGTGTSYPAGTTFTMGTADVTLFAQWQIFTYTVTYDGNNNDAGTAPVDANDYEEGAPVSVLGNTGGLLRTGYPFFIGWNTAADGSGTTYRPGEVFPMPGSALTLYALCLDFEKILASDGAAGDGFGVSVAISGDYAVVGAHGDDDNGTYSGSAYLFERDGTGTWQPVQKLTASDGAASDYFGVSVAISGDYAVVGAYGDDDSAGSAYLFERDGTGTWQPVPKLTASDGAAGDGFGCSVAISGAYAVVGAYRDDDNGTDSGSAYLFERDGTGTWLQVPKLTASDGAADDRFGVTVAISGDYAVVAAYFNSDNGTASGSAYLFERDGTGTWQPVQKLTASDGAASDYFGQYVAISGDYAVVGAMGDDGQTGSAYVQLYR